MADTLDPHIVLTVLDNVPQGLMVRDAWNKGRAAVIEKLRTDPGGIYGFRFTIECGTAEGPRNIAFVVDSVNHQGSRCTYVSATSTEAL